MALDATTVPAPGTAAGQQQWGIGVARSGARPFVAYAVTALLSLAILFRVLRLWEADLAVPLGYNGDGLLFCLIAKSFSENPWYLVTPRLGLPAPATYLHDFPFGDTLHLTLLKLFVLVTPSFGSALNLLFYASFPAAALSALWVFRRLGVSYPVAIVGSLLFAFLPYHGHRGVGHLFLSLYYLVPPAVLVALWLGKPDGPMLVHWRRGQGDSDDSDRTTAAVDSSARRRLLVSALICALVSAAGFYYAAFACFFLSVAGASAAFVRRQAAPLVIGAGLAVLILIGCAANTIPNLLYWRAHGPNPIAHRAPQHSEIFGLKIAQLVLPVTDHRLAPLRERKDVYNNTMLFVNENSMAALGVVGTAGFLLLLGCLAVRPGPPPQHQQRAAPPYRPVLDQLATLNIFALLLATVGGFSSLIALFVSGQIRAYNRISVYIGFFALFAVVLCLDRWYRRAAVSSPARRGAFLAGLGVLLGVGLFDQSARSFTPHYAGVRARYAADAAFVARIEASAGPKGKVFQLPYEPFPEPDPQVGNMGKYDHLRGYLHSKTLRWSYGSVKGRPADLWQRRLAGKPVPEMVRDLRAAGFAGIWVDRSGLTDGGAALERDLRRLLGTPPTVESRETHRVYYALSAPAGPAAASQQADVGQ